MYRNISLIILIFCLSTQSFAQSSSSSKNPAPSDNTPQLNLLYPELHVVPKASDRLKLEAKKEKTERWSTHLPVQISATMTLLAGIYGQSNKPDTIDSKTLDDHRLMTTVSTAIGASWLIATTLMSNSYTPYENGMSDISKLSEKSQTDQLMKERMAEEALEKPADLGRKITWLAVTTNLVGSIMAGANSGQNGKIMGALSAIAAFTPVVFKYNWIETHNLHQQYKKKIYGPVVTSTLFVNHKEVFPGLLVSYNF